MEGNGVVKKDRGVPFDGAPFEYFLGGTVYQYGQADTYHEVRDSLFSVDNPAWTITRGLLHKYPDVYASQRDMWGSVDMGNGHFSRTYMRRIPHIRHKSYRRDIGVPIGFDGPVLISAGYAALKNLVLQGITWPTEEELSIQLFERGGTAINRTLPNKSQANLAVTLAELKSEGLPRLIGSGLLKRGANADTKWFAGQYLGVEFGWKPIINELVTMLNAVRDSTKILREYENLRDKNVRRRFAFPQERKSEEYVGTSYMTAQPSMSYFYSDYGAYPKVFRTYIKDTWFSGSYRFYVPPSATPLAEKISLWEREANKLLGTRITPEVLYNLTPWSWLLDWYVTFGNVVSNISHIGQDGLVLNYGYIMQHTRVDAQVTLPGLRLYGEPDQVGERVIFGQKARRQASPYGFGLKPGDLTPNQWSILLALGIAKAPGSLHGSGFN